MKKGTIMDETSMDNIFADERQAIIAKKLIDAISATLDMADKYDNVELDSLIIKMFDEGEPVVEFRLQV